MRAGTVVTALNIRPLQKAEEPGVTLPVRHLPINAHLLLPSLPFVFIDLNHFPGPSRAILEMEGRKEERGREEKGKRR